MRRGGTKCILNWWDQPKKSLIIFKFFYVIKDKMVNLCEKDNVLSSIVAADDLSSIV